jgi:hypothetical protein
VQFYRHSFSVETLQINAAEEINLNSEAGRLQKDPFNIVLNANIRPGGFDSIFIGGGFFNMEAGKNIIIAGETMTFREAFLEAYGQAIIENLLESATAGAGNPANNTHYQKTTLSSQ